jgi:hypothetical protein
LNVRASIAEARRCDAWPRPSLAYPDETEREEAESSRIMAPLLQLSCDIFSELLQQTVNVRIHFRCGHATFQLGLQRVEQ